MLKVLVDNAYQLTEPHPNTLFCLLEYDGNRLTTSHNQVQGGRVRYNEEAEFSIKKPGNLRIQLCSVEGKPGLLSLEEHKLFGRAKYPINYDTQKKQTLVLHDLELKSKSGKPRARMKLTITVPGNPNAQPIENQRPEPKISNSFRGSERSSAAGSRNSLDSAGFDSQRSSMFEEVSPKYSRPNSGRFFDNPSQSLTSIDDIQEHEPVKKREKSKNPFAKSARNTVIGTSSAKNNNISSVEGDLDQLRVAKLAQDNRILTDKLKSRDREIKELNLYIESLLVKIMAHSPDILQS